MIHNIKLGLKLTRFSPNLKGSLASICLFVAFGIVYLFLFRDEGNILLQFLGLYFLAMPAFMISQIIPTCCYSGLVKSSELGNHFIADVAVFTQLFLALINYAIIIGAIFLGDVINLVADNNKGYLILSNGLLMGVFIIYSSMAYKGFIVSTILFVVSFLGMYVGNIMYSSGQLAWLEIGSLQGILGGILCMLVGSVIAYGLAKLLWRRPMDKRAMANQLKAKL